MLDSPEEVCGVRMESHGYKNEFECCDKIKLFLENIPEELLKTKTGIRYEYLLTDSGNTQFEVTIDEINATDKYIILKKYHYDIAPLMSGKVELFCILDYDKLPNINRLNQLSFDTFPSFHETHIDIIKKDKDHLHLRFSGGFHPLITNIKMNGIFKEKAHMENNIDPFDYFTKDGCVGRVQFQTIENHFIVKISDNYTSHELIGWYEGISFEEIQQLQLDPDNTKTEEHINEYTIYCSNISLKFKGRTD
jgi:cellulose biosynthesis protein BcsQ